MVKNNTAGFTLIELTLAMAISAGLLVIVFTGFGNMRAQAQFSNAIDGLKEQVTAIRTEATTTVNIRTGAGTDSTQVMLGRMLTFRPYSTDIEVQDILADGMTEAAGTTLANSRTITIPWGVKYNGAQIAQVAFFKNLHSGLTLTAVSLPSEWVMTGSPYSDLIDQSNGSEVNLEFIDPSNRKATLDIDPKKNSIGRTFE